MFLWICIKILIDNVPVTVIFKQNLLHLLSEFKTGPGGEMVDTLVSGASASRRVGSTPISGTNKNRCL